MSEYLSTTEVATLLGVSAERVRQLIVNGRLKALRFQDLYPGHGTRVGNVYLVRPEDVEAVRHRINGWPKGRPRKQVPRAPPRVEGADDESP